MAGKFLWVLALSLVSWGEVHGQLSIFQDEEAIITPNFSEDVIRAEKISRITMHDFSKPDGSPISDDSTERCYFFDSAGKIIQTVCTVKTSNGNFDTIKCRYYYDALGNLSVKRIDMGDLYDTWYYKWYKDQLMQTSAHIHETMVLTKDSSYKFNAQQIISTDSFAYISYPKQLQQYAYNEDNKYFRKSIIQYDDEKRILSRNAEFAVGSLFSKVDITYDASGRISDYLYTGNMNGEISKKTHIQYDTLGKINRQDIWDHNKQSHQIEFMYDNETGLISNKLDRDEDKGIISIIRFSYEMFENKSDSTVGK
jgi:hypothetical protein